MSESLNALVRRAYEVSFVGGIWAEVSSEELIEFTSWVDSWSDLPVFITQNQKLVSYRLLRGDSENKKNSTCWTEYGIGSVEHDIYACRFVIAMSDDSVNVACRYFYSEFLKTMRGMANEDICKIEWVSLAKLRDDSLKRSIEAIAGSVA